MSEHTPGICLSSASADEIKSFVQRLTAHCQAFRAADTRKALLQLAVTAIPFFAVIALMLWSAHQGLWWIVAALLLPASGLLVRLFIIQHDCGHGSYLPSRRANDILGSIISVFTFTPYGCWLKAHNLHHAGSGNLERRGIGSIDTLTVAEYQALPPRKRFLYRFYRNPFVLLILGTPWYTIVSQRFPPGQTSPFLDQYQSLTAEKSWRSVLALDVALVVFYGALGLAVGWLPVFAVCLPVVTVTAWIGGWLFFIQHQFEDAYWEERKNWSFHEAAVLGSSYYALHPVLQWFTGNIGLHHIHHLCPTIPNYRLAECLAGSRELQTLNRMTLLQSLKCAGWALWDEKLRKMVTFRDLRMMQAAA